MDLRRREETKGSPDLYAARHANQALDDGKFPFFSE
jgi:hypothetical protein